MKASASVIKLFTAHRSDHSASFGCSKEGSSRLSAGRLVAWALVSLIQALESTDLCVAHFIKVLLAKVSSILSSAARQT